MDMPIRRSKTQVMRIPVAWPAFLRPFVCLAFLSVAGSCVVIPYQPKATVQDATHRVVSVYDPEFAEKSSRGYSHIPAEETRWRHVECLRDGIGKADSRYSTVVEKDYWRWLSSDQKSMDWDALLAKTSSRNPPDPALDAGYIVAVNAVEVDEGGLYAGAYGGPFSITERVTASATLLTA